MVDNQNYYNNYIKPRIYLQSKTSNRTFYLYCVFSFGGGGGGRGSINSKDTRQVLTVHLNLINKKNILKNHCNLETYLQYSHICHQYTFQLTTQLMQYLRKPHDYSVYFVPLLPRVVFICISFEFI